MITQYAISALSPGMKLGNDALTQSGIIVLAKHTVLTQRLIDGLQEWGCSVAHILETPQPSAENIQQRYIDEHGKILKSLGDAFNKTRTFKEVPVNQINDIALSTMKSLLNFKSVLSFLHLINTKDDYTFRHSLNVAVIAGVVGKWLLFNEEQLKDLVLAGLLHDIGKTKIPLEILNKPGKLTPQEMDLMKKHPMLGYELLAEHKEINYNVKESILQHHERLDGSGYPKKLLHHDISRMANIIAVADTYDAMTSHRVYRSALTPVLVMEELMQEMYGKLNAEICMLFINSTKEALIGSSVRLSNGTEGKIIFMNVQNTVEPLIQTTDGKYIDLKKEKNIEIIEFISNFNIQ